MRVELRHLGHRFDSANWIFRDLNSDMHPGEITALTGPSGSGKSTLLSIIAGWTQPVEGTVVVDEVNKTNWVFQNAHGVARRTALDHVKWPLLALGLPNADAEDEARELLGMFSLAPRAQEPFAALSGGEAQRLMLARSLAARPDLLLVDEPTAQLDRMTARIVNDCIRNVAREDTIVIVATHDSETVKNCDSVLSLSTPGEHQ